MDFIMERLDRVVANHAWQDLFLNFMASIEGVIFFDHLALSINPNGCKRGCRKGRGFQYEANWGNNPACK